MRTKRRRIGPVGTAARAITGIGLLSLQLADGLRGGLDWGEAALGLVVFPAVMIGIGLGAGRFLRRPIRFGGLPGLVANAAVIAVLAVNDQTGDATGLFYGVSLLVAAWFALPGCEATMISNVLLDRDDQIGCPIFTPLDDIEAGIAARRAHVARPAAGSAAGEPDAALIGGHRR